MFDRPGTIVQVVAISQHVHDLPVPEQGDVVPRFCLPREEEKDKLVMAPSTPPFLEWWGHHGPLVSIYPPTPQEL